MPYGLMMLGRRFPSFRDAELVIADPVVRNRGTIGGSLCQADAAEDLSAVCSALKADVVIRGSGDLEEEQRAPWSRRVALHLLSSVSLRITAERRECAGRVKTAKRRREVLTRPSAPE